MNSGAGYPPPWAQPLQTDPPRSGSAIVALARSKARLMRWAMWIVVALDVILVVVVTANVHASDRLEFALAMAPVLGVYTLPVIFWYRLNYGRHLALLRNGVRVEATVTAVESSMFRGTNVHRIRTDFDGPGGVGVLCWFTATGADAGVGQGDTVLVITQFGDRRRLTAAVLPNHGLGSGRFRRVPVDGRKAQRP